MGRMSLLIILLFLGVIALFSFFNSGSVVINVPFDKEYEVSKIGLILLSSVSGALLILVIFLIRDTKRFILTHQFQRRQKKEGRMQALYSKAINAILAEDDTGARATLEEIVKEEPSHADALLRLGDIMMRKRRFEDALNHYRKAMAANPDNIEALICMERVMEEMRRHDDALFYVEKILDIDADNLNALHRKRALLERENRWDDLIDLQKTILKHEHDDKNKKSEEARLLGFRYELARDSLEKGGLEKAGKGFRALLREDKNFVPGYLGVAEAMIAGGETESAVSYLEKSYEITSSQIVLARLEDLLISLGEPSRLIRTYKKAISSDPKNNALKFFMGKLYFRLEMVDDAFETLTSLDVGDSYPDLHKLLGELYLRRDMCPKAVEYFKKTLELRKTYRIPYCCGHCGHSDEEWTGRCPKCGSWNTYQFNLHGVCKV